MRCDALNIKRLSLLAAWYTLRPPLTHINPEDDCLVDSKPAPQNIQDGFLNLARREKTTVTVYLVNGAKLLGRIKSFDKFSLIMETGASEQLIFKHAISTISQARRSTGELRAPHVSHPGDLPEHTEETSSS